MSEDSFLLLNPGPVQIHPAVRAAMDAPMISHRSPAFEETFARTRAGLHRIFTESALEDAPTTDSGTTLLLNGTATMGMEAAVANLAGPGDEVLAVVNGKFGRRFARIADRHATGTRVEFDWGESIDVDAVAEAIGPDTELVTMVHTETSTGLVNPVGAVGELAREADATFVVDAVTTVGGDAFRIDDWNVDVAVTDAQKALAAPPGISATYLSERAQERLDGEGAPFYEDLEWHLRKAAAEQTPFTTAVPLVRAMAVAVERILADGIHARIQRHRQYTEAYHAGFGAMGLEPFPEPTGETAYANTMAAIALPEPVRGEGSERFHEALAERNVSVAGGQAHIAGELFRIGAMGELTPADVLRGIEAVGGALNDAGADLDVTAGVRAAEDTLLA